MPHRDEPDDDDGEFINDANNEYGARQKGASDSEESGDNALMDDAKNIEDSPVEFVNELAKEEAAEGRPVDMADDGNDLCINNDLNLVLDEDPKGAPKDDDDIQDSDEQPD